MSMNQSTIARAKILLVEDSAIVAQSIKDQLTHLGYEVVGTCHSGEEVIQKVSEYNPDLLLMDISLDGHVDGVEAVKQIRSFFEAPVVYVTACSDDRTIERAELTEPLGILFKPFDLRSLKTAVELALHKHKMDRQRKALVSGIIDELIKGKK